LSTCAPSIYGALFRTSVTSTQENSLAALIQRLTAAFPYQVSQPALHAPDLARLGVEFHKLFPRESLPAFGGTSRSVKPKEKLPDFFKRETESPRLLNQRKTVKNSRVVAPLSADSLRGRKQADLLVVADRRRSQSNSSCHIGDVQRRHAGSLND